LGFFTSPSPLFTPFPPPEGEIVSNPFLSFPRFFLPLFLKKIRLGPPSPQEPSTYMMPSTGFISSSGIRLCSDVFFHEVESFFPPFRKLLRTPPSIQLFFVPFFHLVGPELLKPSAKPIAPSMPEFFRPPRFSLTSCNIFPFIGRYPQPSPSVSPSSCVSIRKAVQPLSTLCHKTHVRRGLLPSTSLPTLPPLSSILFCS